MTDNEKILRQAESFAGWRRLLLVTNALAYVAWIGAQALYFVDGLSVGNRQVVLIQSIAGPLWLISLLALFFMIFRLKGRRDMLALIDDERTRQLGARAFQAGYWVLLISIALLYALTFLGYRINSLGVLPVLLSLGVAVPGLTYAMLYRS